MRVQGLRVLVLAGLLLPALILPAVPSRVPEHEGSHPVSAGMTESKADMLQDVHFDADFEALPLLQKADTRTLLRYLVEAPQAAPDGLPEPAILETLRIPRPAAADSLGDQTQAETPLLWVGNAQAALAALGAATHTGTHSVPQPVVSAASMATILLPAQLDLAPPSHWFAIAFWAVFLTSIGALLAPRLSGALALGLYARLNPHEVERHPRRSILLAALREHPGQHLASLARTTGIDGGALRHHLHQLSYHGLARRVRKGRATYWFPVGAPAVVPPSEAQSRVLEQLRSTPDVTLAELSTRLSVSTQNVWKLLRSLARAHLAVHQKTGRTMHWRAATA